MEITRYLRVHFSTREILFFMTTVPAKVSIASLSMKFRLLVTLAFNCRFVCTNGLSPRASVLRNKLYDGHYECSPLGVWVIQFFPFLSTHVPFPSKYTDKSRTRDPGNSGDLSLIEQRITVVEEFFSREN